MNFYLLLETGDKIVLESDDGYLLLESVVYKLDVAASDVLLNLLSATDALVNNISVSDSAINSVSVSEATRD